LESVPFCFQSPHHAGVLFRSSAFVACLRAFISGALTRFFFDFPFPSYVALSIAKHRDVGPELPFLPAGQPCPSPLLNFMFYACISTSFHFFLP